MSRERLRHSAEVKAQIVRRHLSGKEPVSKLAEEFGVQPSRRVGFRYFRRMSCAVALK